MERLGHLGGVHQGPIVMVTIGVVIAQTDHRDGHRGRGPTAKSFYPAIISMGVALLNWGWRLGRFPFGQRLLPVGLAPAQSLWTAGRDGPHRHRLLRHGL